MYTERFYRKWTSSESDLETFRVVLGESDLQVYAERNLRNEALKALSNIRRTLHKHIALNPIFQRSLTPVTSGSSNPLIKRMEEAGREWNTGPMASVAGAIAQEVGTRLLKHSKRVIVENGGDIWACTPEPLEFLIYPGEKSPFSKGINFTLNASQGISICTSSGKVGPSFSLGRADAVTAIHSCAAQADAAATSLANLIRCESDVTRVVEEVACRRKLKAVIATCGESIGIWGEIHLTDRKRAEKCLSQ
ncbi:MAG: UPF0280 family protein [Candidatus Sabulitectum sp.]|nr:UPF0280 family protein [Candidatus Sabulitectum sp.]